MPRSPETVRTGYCSNRWCHRPLELCIDSLGRVIELPCERCARFQQGRCWQCSGRLDPKDERGYRSRFCKRCRIARSQVAHNAASKRWQKRNRNYLLEQKQGAYAKRRMKVSARNRVKRNRMIRDYSVPKTRECSEPGCENLIVYYSRPPVRCDECWDKYQTRREQERRDKRRRIA